MEARQLYLGMVGLSLLTSVGRADYNLPLFGLLCLTSAGAASGERRWRQQRFFLAVVVCSVVFDVAYIVYWSRLWFSEDWQAWLHWSYALSVWTMVWSSLGVLAKLGLIAYVFRPELMVLLGRRAKEDVIEEYEIYKYLPVPQGN